jgi:hypothetical protein
MRLQRKKRVSGSAELSLKWYGNESIGRLHIETDLPRLSAAMTTPSLNLMATTDVPVTTGDCVACFGPESCR